MTRLSFAIATVSTATSSFFIVLLIGVTVVDVIGRYWFNTPLSGAFELTEVLLAMTVFAALPAVTAREGHLSADLIAEIAGPRGLWMLAQFGRALTAVIFLVLTVILAQHGISLQTDGFRTNALDLPIAPVAFVGALCCGLSGLLACGHLVRHRAP